MSEILYGMAATVDLWAVPIVAILVGLILLIALMVWDQYHE